MKSVVSIIDNLLEDYHEKNNHSSDEIYDHIVLGIDVTETGDPSAKIVKVQGKSINVLGMLALLENQIADLKEKVRLKFSEIENKKALYNALPKGVADKLQALENSLRERMQNGDVPTADEIEELKNKARQIFDESLSNDDSSSSSSKEDDGFNINDFKSGF